jgi:hypothetical protein
MSGNPAVEVRVKATVEAAVAEVPAVMAVDLVRIAAAHHGDARMTAVPGPEAPGQVVLVDLVDPARMIVAPGQAGLLDLAAPHAAPARTIEVPAPAARAPTVPVAHGQMSRAPTALRETMVPGLQVPAAPAVMNAPEVPPADPADLVMMAPGMTARGTTAHAAPIQISGRMTAGAGHPVVSKAVPTLNPFRAGGSGFLPNQNPLKPSSVRSRPPAAPILSLKWAASSSPGVTVMW